MTAWGIIPGCLGLFSTAMHTVQKTGATPSGGLGLGTLWDVALLLISLGILYRLYQDRGTSRRSGSRRAVPTTAN